MLAALLLGLGAAGCDASGSTTQSAAPQAQPRPFHGVTYYDPRQRLLLHTMEETSIASCMRARGFVYRPQPLSDSDHTADANPYGLLTLQQARNDGFGITSSALDARPFVDANAAEDGSAAWKAALDGTTAHRVYLTMPGHRQFFYNADACATRAVVELYGAQYYRLFNTLQILSNQVVTTVQADPRFLAAQRRWQACMSAAGQPAGSLSDPLSSVSARLRPALASHDPARIHTMVGFELNLAEADAECQATAGLADSVAASQQDAERAAITSHAGDLAELQALQRRALATGTPAGGGR